MDLLNVADFEARAAELLDAGTYAYYAGGANDERTLHENVAAWDRWALRPRILVDVSEVTTRTSLLGRTLAMPLVVAPMAYQRMAHPDGEVAMGRAILGAGSLMTLSSLATSTRAEVAATGVPRWYQLYVPKDAGKARAILDDAVEHGFEALVLTVDTPVLGRRERDLRLGWHVPPTVRVQNLGEGEVSPLGAFSEMSAAVTWRDVEKFAADTKLPVILKGVYTADDARLAVEHGASAVIVSNHGGRQLDAVVGSAEALPEVADAIAGAIPVLVDGGIRRGTDVLKALALGATAAMVGRPLLWGLTVDGEAGAAAVLELFRAEISLGLQLLGCTAPSDITRAHITRRPT
ncbi:MAG: alpha-hydroxy-acid oxidizing protein [Actinobacteria bacterium]|uniref:Unannotated protein n=1 Tax=freshwater metagenome TaxID=449393 RepID=A0A6J6NNU2_9ZZZZ|nr:alpha-hydroxy-acid oxidizing protein [Actinomycetota bacterium]